MINVKIKVETDEQNLKVQEKLCELNKENGRTAWRVYLSNGNDYCYYQDYDSNRAVCSRWKQYKYLVINKILDLVIYIDEWDWKQRKEKEVSFEEFMKNKIKDVEAVNKNTFYFDGVSDWKF